MPFQFLSCLRQLTFFFRRRRPTQPKKKAVSTTKELKPETSVDDTSAALPEISHCESISTVEIPVDETALTPADETALTDVKKNDSRHTANKMSMTLSRVDEFGCIADEDDYDDAVVELARHNYDSFYGFEHGTVTLEELEATSAGVRGWAASIVEEDPIVPVLAVETIAPAVSLPKSRGLGDREEAQKLQTALLQSMGVRTPHLVKKEEKVQDSADKARITYNYSSDEEESTK